MINPFKLLHNHYKIFEFKSKDLGLLPSPPSDKEKWLYAKRHTNVFMILASISFVGINISLLRFLLANPAMWIIFFMFFLTVIYFVLSLLVNFFTKEFNVNKHKAMVAMWKPEIKPTIDVFLPTAGESIEVLRNTWTGVAEMIRHYEGVVHVYSLDDAASPEVKALAKEFKFRYEVRENRGYYKKAGNLRHGFNISSNELIVIFDADFVPRKDFLNELVPYFERKKIGIVQSPQYFDVHHKQNWLERAAGAVQELFYRFSQLSRDSHDASICVGSNAIYRRAALKETGGTALIEHSEDVHTGFNLRSKGWKLVYVPVILAKGLCPSSMTSFFKQQYRWCMGSLSLLTSKKFWKAKMKFRARLSYISGFAYYIHTALSSFYTPIIPLYVLLIIPDKISFLNYILIIPAFIFTQIVYPLWHKSTYGIEAWSVRQVYGWAHMFAIWDKIFNTQMGWIPTGAKVKKDMRYTSFRACQILFNFVPSVLWTSLALYMMVTISVIEFLPIFLSGVYYMIVSSKVTFYITDISKLKNIFSKNKLGLQDI